MPTKHRHIGRIEACRSRMGLSRSGGAPESQSPTLHIETPNTLNKQRANRPDEFRFRSLSFEIRGFRVENLGG